MSNCKYYNVILLLYRQVNGILYYSQQDKQFRYIIAVQVRQVVVQELTIVRQVKQTDYNRNINGTGQSSSDETE